MSAEANVALMLLNEFRTIDLQFDDEGFQLSQCRYFVQEACAQTYLATTEADNQIEIIQNVLFKLQEKGNEILSSIFFGSPLLGIKALREAITAEIVELIDDAINAQITEALHRMSAENRADYYADENRFAEA